MFRAMHTLIIYAHPNPTSFNHALLDTCVHTLQAAGEQVIVKDLYKEGFNPILSAEDLRQMKQDNTTPTDIAAEQELLRWANRLIFIYPIWWYDRPAILKGWFDRVFTNGFAFRYGAGGAEGLLTHLRALVIQTIGESQQFYESINATQLIQRSIAEGTLGFCGIPSPQVKSFFNLPGTPETRTAMLEETRQTVKNFLT